MRAGDVVFHRPSRETWLLAYAEDGMVSACGWPESCAKEADCLLVDYASDAAHLAMLRTWAEGNHRRDNGSDDHRALVCRRQLNKLRAASPPTASSITDNIGAPDEGVTTGAGNDRHTASTTRARPGMRDSGVDHDGAAASPKDCGTTTPAPAERTTDGAVEERARLQAEPRDVNLGRLLTKEAVDAMLDKAKAMAPRYGMRPQDVPLYQVLFIPLVQPPLSAADLKYVRAVVARFNAELRALLDAPQAPEKAPDHAPLHVYRDDEAGVWVGKLKFVSQGGSIEEARAAVRSAATMWLRLTESPAAPTPAPAPEGRNDSGRRGSPVGDSPGPAHAVGGGHDRHGASPAAGNVAEPQRGPAGAPAPRTPSSASTDAHEPEGEQAPRDVVMERVNESRADLARQLIAMKADLARVTADLAAAVARAEAATKTLRLMQLATADAIEAQEKGDELAGIVTNAVDVHRWCCEAIRALTAPPDDPPAAAPTVAS